MNGEWAANLFPRSPAPGFRPTDLALPLFPGRSLGKPQSSTNPETPMPLAPAMPYLSKKFSPAPAASLPTQPISLFFPDPASAVSEIGDHRFPHAPALPLFVLVKRRPAWDPVSGWVQSRCRSARKTFLASVLVKGVGTASVFLASFFARRCCSTRFSETLAPAQRARGHWWAWRHAGTLGRMRWARMAGQFSGARQIVLVRSLSPCAPPLPLSGNPGAASALNGGGVFHA